MFKSKRVKELEAEVDRLVNSNIKLKSRINELKESNGFAFNTIYWEAEHLRKKYDVLEKEYNKITPKSNEELNNLIKAAMKYGVDCTIVKAVVADRNLDSLIDWKLIIDDFQRLYNKGEIR